jgi:hypothetical protein
MATRLSWLSPQTAFVLDINGLGNADEFGIAEINFSLFG